MACKSGQPTNISWGKMKFNLFTTTDTINLQVTDFVKNSTYCYTHAIPYAILIGQTSNAHSSAVPKTITVLAKCDNNKYSIGQSVKVVAIEDPTTKTTLKPLYITRDTIINKTKYHLLVGAEYPAIWAKVL
jgi:hypothetical protein